MAEPFSPDGPQQLLTDLCRLVAERVPAEARIAADFERRNHEADAAWQEARKQLAESHQREKAAAEAEYAAVKSSAAVAAETEHAVVQKQYDAASAEITARFETDKSSAEQELQDAHLEATAIAEAALGGLGHPLAEVQAEVEARWRELQAIHQRAVALMQHWGQWRHFTDPQPTWSLLERYPMRRFSHALELARTQFEALSRQILPAFFQGLRPMGLLLLLWGLTIYPAGALLGWDNWHWAAASSGGSFVVGIVLGTWLYVKVRRNTAGAYMTLRRTLVEAGMDRPATLETAKADCHRLYAAIDSRYKAEVKRASDKFTAVTTELVRRKEHELQQVEATYPPRLAEIAARRERALREADDKYPRRLREIDDRFRTESHRLQEAHARAMAESRAQFEREWAEMSDRWRSGVARFSAAVCETSRTCDRLFPDWHTPDWSRWKPPAEIPAAVRFGHSGVRLARIAGGVPEDERLRPPEIEFTLPALLPLPQHSLLMFKANGDGRGRAIDAIQAVMLRLLTALPPGKVRFTILDPVGLGENFSAFMHLADYEELLVASRIWTNTEHIEQRLADLTQHMENVIQVYLRNEFQSIQEYNTFAGEMAEPYRVLVVANFPANFSEVAAHRLKSIVASGARCGVFVLMSVDTKLQPPHHFHLADLEAGAMVLGWQDIVGARSPDHAPNHGGVGRPAPNDGCFVYEHPDYGPLPLVLDGPPDAERFTEAVRAVGQVVKDAGRVEVPFSCIAPPPEEEWTADSRGGLDVPLGRAGAKKLQHLDLGKGTSQHVLVSGKTGSGKSTLLHVLITNLALRYSPDEVELYLVDFKKGVEFKAYARYMLPHARVIAIESEREFGLSVLQRLDAELRTRGDLFRRLGVQDLKGYRNSGAGAPLAARGTGSVRARSPDRARGATGGLADAATGDLRSAQCRGQETTPQQGAGETPAPQPAILPRIMLIIDEFQELFVEDDRIAQEAALLLDRLVRQGRAFGIHVLLGSQTLGGAYSLARSTIGQMAVRIALQCSDSDAHLILSEDNTAARLLTRPGEAIYNDANGLYEGNHPFQIVWLPDDQRDEYLERIGVLARERAYRAAPPVVFEGNVWANLGENVGLQALLAAADWPASCPAPQAWLGAAVAIKEPTAATFVRQAGSNLLLVGHREEASLGVMASCLLSLAAQHPPAGLLECGDSSPLCPANFYILDGTRPDAPEAGFWGGLAPTLPHATKVALPRNVPDVLAELAAEVARRQQEGQDRLPPIYLFIYNLGRFRDLRKEDEFSFGGLDEGRPASPAKHLTTLLRDGPALGIHTIAWCDSYSSVNRLLDRQTLRDFEMRVLFQMSATDSSSLMDSPEAGKLGVHRAIYYDEGQGRMEKFRPYGPPAPDWLAQVARQLHKVPRI